jgi:hypothetical protein
MEIPKLLPEHIVGEQLVIHPALDWRDGVLIMGVSLAEGGRGVLNSRGELLLLDKVPFPICDRSRNFSRSPVSENVARRVQEGYGTPGSETAHALVDVSARLAGYYRRFLVFPEPWWPELLALWTLGTYLYPLFSSYPYLRISSPEPGCGKSLLGEIISKLSFNGELMVSPTEANVFRIAESERGTQVWDEVENQSEADRSRLQVMKSVLLNGYRAGGFVPRQERVGHEFETVRFHVYVPRVLIGLSDLPPVVRQRTIELPLHRRSPAEEIERYLAHERETEERDLREMCALYALTYCGAVSRQYRRKDLAKALERHLGQAGRLPDDLLLPLVAVCAAPTEHATGKKAVMATLQTLVLKAAPELARGWNEVATTTSKFLAPALEALEASDGLEPEDLANRVSGLLGVSVSAEQIAHELKRYGVRSQKKGGRRVFSVSQGQIDQLRARYGIADPGVEPKLAAVGQIGQIGQ